MRQVIGLECDAAMADSARENIRRLRGRRSATLIVTADAAAVDFGETTAIVLFNPFGPATVRSMLVCLRASLDVNPRSVRVAYVNPIAASELDRCDWLTRVRTTRRARYRYSVSVWETTGVS